MSIAINETNFPGSTFRRYLSSYCDTDGDGVLSDSEIAAITRIPISSYNGDFTVDSNGGLVGIEHLTGLKELYINSDIDAVSITVPSNQSLEHLQFSNCRKLRYVSISNLPNLKYLNCSNCAINGLDVSSNTNLEELHIFCSEQADYSTYPAISTLDLSSNTKLKALTIKNTNISTLDLSNNTQLNILDIQKTIIPTIDLSHNTLIEEVHINNVSSLTLGTCNNLKKFYCVDAGINDVFSLSGCTALEELSISNSSFTGIDVSGCSSLSILGASGCQNLTSVNISGCSLIKYVGRYSSVSTEYDNNNDFTAYVNLYNSNNITSFNFSGCTALKEFSYVPTYGSKFALSSLNFTGCTSLQSIKCQNSIITNLDVRDCTALTSLYCSGNRITSLQLGQKPNLSKLYCEDNVFTTLDISQAPIITGLIENVEPSFHEISEDIQKLCIEYENYETHISSFIGDFKVNEGVSITTATGTIPLPDSSLIEDIAINSTNFPDAVFRNYISTEFDTDQDGVLCGREIILITEINIASGVMSVEGIHNFPRCTHVKAGSGATITSLDLHNNNIIKEITLVAVPNLTSVNVSGCTSLWHLTVSRCSQVESLDVSTCSSLTGLYCDRDALSTITFGNNPYLYEIECQYNQLEVLDISNLPRLKYIKCYGNSIPDIDISNCPDLIGIFRASEDPYMLDIIWPDSDNRTYNAFTQASISVDYDTEVIGAISRVTSNPTDLTIKNGDTAVFNVAASGIDLSYQWQERSLAPVSQATITNNKEILDVYSDGSIRIKPYEEVSGNILTLLADYHLPKGVYRVLPNASQTGTGIDLKVWSARYPPIGFGILADDPAENDPCVNESCSSGSTNGITFTVTNPTQYFTVIVRATGNAQITEQILHPTIERHVDGNYEDISYIWSYYPIWNNVSGATTDTLSLAASAGNDNTQYRCKVSNVFSKAFSEPAELGVILPPTIIQQPQQHVVKPDTSVVFSVEAVANGDSNSYQWQVSMDGGETWADAENGSTSGDSTSEYTITATKSMDHYLYRCVATNIVGTATSDPAELRVLIEPSITAQPEDTTVETTKTARFSITAAGDELSYQWQVSTDDGATWDNTELGGHLSSHTIETLKSLNGNKYRCVVTNDVGSATSNAASLKVMDRPTILDDPTSVTTRDGNNVSFSVNATGDELSYQWQVSTDGGVNWEDIAGETTDTYSFTALFAMNGNNYRCKVYNTVKTGHTDPALLTVTIQPSITTQPQDARIASGSNAVFSVEVTDREGAGLAYTWQVKESENGEWIAVSGDAYSGNSTASLTVTASADIDGYRYRCFIEGGHDSIMSESAAIDVVTPPVITGELQNTTIRSGSPVSFTASAEGKYTSYQWQTYLHERWTNIDGAANDTYTLIQENPAETGIGTVMYRYTVTNIAGTVASSAATVTVIPSIVITSQPLSAESPAGGVVRFTVGAAGERLRYRWQTRGRSSSAWSNVSGELYEGETTQTLSVSVETALSGNQYRCIITDEYSDGYPSLSQIVTSDAAILTTSSLQVILTQPIDTTVAAGDLASFEVIADDEGYAYQWQVSTDGGDTWSNIQNNGNAPVYVFTANADQSGEKFCCVVTSDRWAVISRAATLTVATEPVIESEPQDARVGEDKSAEFHIGASGVELQYQWQISTDGINWTDIPDDRARTDTISVTAAMQANGSRYRCKVYNIAGTVYSRDAVLSVIEKIRILANPEDQVTANGDTVSFSVSVSGYSPGYQWQEKAADSDAWINVQDASAAGMTLNVTANEQSNGKRYRCIIMNDAGEEASASALLTVYFKPVFTVQPHGGDVDESSVVSLHAEANGGGVSYQWQSKRENSTYWSDLTIDGATSDTLPLTAHVAINGIQYRCVATNLAGTTESEPATFHVDVTSFCLADGSEIDEGVLPAGYYTFNLNADRKGVVYDIGLFDGANTDWIVVEASSARTFYTNGRKAIKILFHHTDNADLEYYAIRPMLEEGQEAHQWASPANAAYEHDAANDFNYGWFSIGNKYGDRENIVTASAPCVMTLRYRPIWKDTL